MLASFDEHIDDELTTSRERILYMIGGILAMDDVGMRPVIDLMFVSIWLWGRSHSVSTTQFEVNLSYPILSYPIDSVALGENNLGK